MNNELVTILKEGNVAKSEADCCPGIYLEELNKTTKSLIVEPVSRQVIELDTC